MSTQTITSTPVLVAAGDTYLSSAQTFPVKVQLLSIGQGSDHSVGDEIRFEATGGSIIEVVDANGKRIGVVPGVGAAVAVAKVAGSPGEWLFFVVPQAPAAHQATPTAQQCWDVLRDNGFVKAE